MAYPQLKEFVGFVASPGNPHMSYYRTPDAALLGATPVLVFGEEGTIFGLLFRNHNTNAAWVNFYDASAANLVTVGTTVPAKRVQVPGALDANNPGEKIITVSFFTWQYFRNGCVIAAVTADTDAASSGPSTSLYAELDYAR
jgi:hypothetical protein